MERLIRRRRECPELGWGAWALLDTGDDAVLRAPRATGRARRSSRCTTSPVARRARTSFSACEGELVDLFEDEDHALDAGELTLELRPYGYRWFRLRRPGALLPP